MWPNGIIVAGEIRYAAASVKGHYPSSFCRVREPIIYYPRIVADVGRIDSILITIIPNDQPVSFLGTSHQCRCTVSVESTRDYLMTISSFSYVESVATHKDLGDLT
jgi:hypothetical protein